MATNQAPDSEPEAGYTSTIFSMAAEGRTASEIAQALNAQGLVPPDHAQWNTETITRIFMNDDSEAGSQPV